jgi:hypothetical protein
MLASGFWQLVNVKDKGKSSIRHPESRIKKE